jgi:hypothetical protein
MGLAPSIGSLSALSNSAGQILSDKVSFDRSADRHVNESANAFGHAKDKLMSVHNPNWPETRAFSAKARRNDN